MRHADTLFRLGLFLMGLLVAGALSAANDLSEPTGVWKYCEPWSTRSVAGVLQNNLPGAQQVNDGDGGLAIDAKVGAASHVAVGPDGTIYFSCMYAHAVRKITPDGKIYRVAGQYGQAADYSNSASVGDGGPATSAKLYQPTALAVDSRNHLYILDYARIRKVAPDGIITTFAGGAPPVFVSGDQANFQQALSEFRFVGPATQAVLRVRGAFDLSSNPSMVIGGDGTLYFRGILGVQRISATGIISPVIESGKWNWLPDSPTIGTYMIGHIALNSKGELYALGGRQPGSVGAQRALLKIDAAGSVTTVLGDDSAFTPLESIAEAQVGPVVAGKAISAYTLCFDAQDRPWWTGWLDGPHFCHWDADNVIRFSGMFQTHSPTRRAIENAPAPLLYGTNGALNIAQLPGGGFVFATYHDATLTSSPTTYPWSVIRVVTPATPTLSPELLVTPSTLSLNAKVGDAVIEVPFSIKNVGSLYGWYQWRTDPSASWLSGTALTQSSDRDVFKPGVTDTCKLMVYPDRLSAPGVYQSKVMVYTLGTSKAPIEVPLTLTLSPAEGPAIAVNPSALSFSAAPGGSNPAPQQLTLTNTGVATLNWSATKNAAWLSFSPTSGSVAPGASQLISVNVDIAGLAQGSHSAGITFAAPGMARTPSLNVMLSLYARPEIGLSATQLNFDAQAGGASPATQRVTITNTGTGTLQFSVSNGGANWYSVSPSSGSLLAGAAQELTVSVNSVGLLKGKMNGGIRVSGVGGVTPANIGVYLTIHTTAHLTAGPGSLIFNANLGGPNPPAQSVTLANDGEGSLTFALADDAGWVGASLEQATLAAGESRAVNIAVDISGLTAGTYRALLAISAPSAENASQSIPVTLNVGDNAYRTLTVNVAGSGSGQVILNPPGGSYASDTVVTLTATASQGTFAGWSGALSGSSNPATIVVDADKTVTATFTYVPAANHPPVLTSPLAVSKNPASVGESVSFSAVAIDADGDALSYSWSFGDAASASGASVTHAFAAEGVFTVTLTVSDGKGGSVSAILTMSINAGGSPITPPPTAGNPLRLTIGKSAASLKFNARGRDSCTLSGIMPDVAAGFDPTGGTVVLNLGGAEASFVLSSKGKAKNGKSTFALSLKRSAKAPFAGGAVPFKAKLAGDLTGAWLEEGVDPQKSASGQSLSLAVSLLCHTTKYAGALTATYSAVAGKGGKLKN